MAPWVQISVCLGLAKSQWLNHQCAIWDVSFSFFKSFLRIKNAHFPCFIPVQNVEILCNVKAFIGLDNYFFSSWTSFPVISWRVLWCLCLDLLNVLKSLGKLPSFSSFHWDQGEIEASLWKVHLVSIYIALPKTQNKRIAVSKWKVIAFFSEKKKNKTNHMFWNKQNANESIRIPYLIVTYFLLLKFIPFVHYSLNNCLEKFVDMQLLRKVSASILCAVKFPYLYYSSIWIKNGLVTLQNKSGIW